MNQRPVSTQTQTRRPAPRRDLPGKGNAPQKTPRKQKRKLSPPVEKLLYFGYFPLAVLYLELLLRLFVPDTHVFDRYFVYIFLFSAAFGGVLWLIGNLIPARRAARAVLGVVIFLVSALFITEYCVYTFFKFYYELRYMFKMAGDVATGFADNTIATIVSNLGFFALAFIPLAVFILFRKTILPDRGPKLKYCAVILIAVILTQLTGVLIANHGTGAFAEDRAFYRSMYSANGAIPRFGLITDLRLEFKYALFGVPEELEADDLLSDLPAAETAAETEEEPATEEPAAEAVMGPEAPAFENNVMDIDLNALAASASDNTLVTMDQYFAAMRPTEKNAYTGYFKGKNLIVLTCEAFSPYVIRKDLTPTLYMMQNEGFVFSNFYQPDWTQSTTGGEFAAMSGIIPGWVNGDCAFYGTSHNSMPFALGNQFRAIGYNTLAYHNNSYSYYQRDKTHPNMGYDYKGLGNGLVLETRYGWPESDLEMMKATVPGYVDEYVSSGKLFHAYYMTVSGHCNYGWSLNNMSKKNRAATENLPYSETIQAYLACQLEVEYALKYIVDYCTEKGVLDDVVIMLTSDHYPYAMTQKSSVDYYQELEPQPYSEQTTERYKNTLIIWSHCMEGPVYVDVPCSSIDMVPTISNLFGLTYDSRLLSGRDILATNYDVADPDSRQPFAVFVDKGAGVSWISCAGIYNAYTKTFTPYPGYEDFAGNGDYISAMTKKANNMCRIAKLIVSKNYYAHAVK